MALIWKVIHFPEHYFWYLRLIFFGAYMMDPSLRFLTTRVPQTGSNSTEVSGSLISDGRIMGIACFDQKMGEWFRIFGLRESYYKYIVWCSGFWWWWMKWSEKEWNGIGWMNEWTMAMKDEWIYVEYCADWRMIINLDTVTDRNECAWQVLLLSSLLMDDDHDPNDRPWPLGTLLNSIAEAKIAGCHPWAETRGASGPRCESHVIKQPLGR